GDDYLCTVVSTIQKHIRSTDLFCRFGGDEFLLLLPDCIEEIATSKMEAVNSELIALKKEYPLSVSYGILYITKENTMDLPEILNTIDQKMYVYKKLHKQSRANAKKENTIEH
ncbi:MAG: diguanylate cyclase, partial [Firmicutes bacterium]|nr:diguanylate cyclase [Candidatus Scybalomonas excrementavium]